MPKQSKRRWFVIENGQDGRGWPWLGPDGALKLWKTRDEADIEVFASITARTYGYCIRPWRLP